MAHSYQAKQKQRLGDTIKGKEASFKADVMYGIGLDQDEVISWEGILSFAEQQHSNLKRVLKNAKKHRQSLTSREFFYLDGLTIIKNLRDAGLVMGEGIADNETLFIKIASKNGTEVPPIKKNYSKKCGFDVFCFDIKEPNLKVKLGEFAKVEVTSNRIFIYRFVA